MSSNLQVDFFQKSPDYWIRRAERSRQGGDLRRAAVLLRHAARLAPASLEARMEYACVLRELHCYEASNREAFAALSAAPDSFIPFGLIGRNMLSLCSRQAAMDSLSFYMALSQHHTDMLPDWDDEVYELENSYYAPRTHHRARFQTLLNIAARRIATGQLEDAERLLCHVASHPFLVSRSRLDALIALYYEQLGNAKLAAFAITSTLRHEPHNAQLSVAGACMLQRLHMPLAARLALLRAATLAHSAADEFFLCTTAEELGLLSVALQVLRRSLRRMPDRLPSCYNLCVCLLKMSGVDEATRYIHLCRELDPDDLLVERLFTRVEQWLDEERTDADITREAAQLPFYGSMLPQEIIAASAPLSSVLEEGAAPFAARLLSDTKFRRLFLSVLSMPDAALSAALPDICGALPDDFSETLLRELLVCDPRDSYAKRFAILQLTRIGAKPPFLVWHEGRVGCVDPTAFQPRTLSLMQRLLIRRVRLAAAMNIGSSCIPYFLMLIARMTRSQRLALASDPADIWPTALTFWYRRERDLPPLRIPPKLCRAACLHMLLRALNTLQALQPLKEDFPHESH